MLTIDIIDNKINNTINGQEIMDLITPSFNRNTEINYSGVYVANQEMIMRPDLAALTFCGDTKALGTLLKINSIGNPFSLDIGELLYIPDSNTISSLPNKPQISQKDNARDSFRQQLQDRISSISQQRKEYLNSVNISNSANTSNSTQIPLPPNVTQPNSEQFTVKNGKLIFGSNIGVCRTNIQQNKSVASIKSAFAQNQIFQ